MWFARSGRVRAGDLREQGNDPQCKLPTQWEPGVTYGGEQRLLLGVLEEARRCLCYPSEHLLAVQARHWVEGWDAPLTFEYVCRHLGLDPDWVRPRLLSLGDQHRPRRLISLIGLGRGYSGKRARKYTLPTLWLRRGLSA